MTTDSKATRRDGAERQQRMRVGTARKLDRIIDELDDQRQQLRALTELLGVELSRPTQDPRR
jgi:hypothetical protein